MVYDNGKHDLGEDYIAWIKDNSVEILKLADDDDSLALSIVRLYTIYSNRPEHAAAALLEAAIDKYRGRQ